MSNPFQLLIVEDESIVRNLLNDLLGREGYSILTAINGHEALEHINQSTIDLILLDIGLPDVNGYQIMDYISSQRSDIPVIVLTGAVSSESAVTALRKGAYDYIRKPFEHTELITTVKNALNYKKEESDRKDLEVKLREHSEHLEQLVAKRTVELKKAHDELEKKVEERTAELKLINRELAEKIEAQKIAENLMRIQRDLGIALGTVSDIGEALSLALDSAFQLEEITCGGVYLVDKITGDLTLSNHKSLPPDFLQVASYCSSDTPQAKLVMSGKMVYNDYKTHLKTMGIEDHGARGGTGLRCVGIMPVKHDGRIIAALNAGSTTHDKISCNSRNILEGIAAQIGSVVAKINVDQALKEKQINLQTLFDSIEDFVFILDSQGRVLHTNPVVHKCLGYSIEEISSMHVLDFHPEDRHAEAEAIIADMRNGKTSLCPIPLRKKDGTLIPVETNVTIGKWDNQNVLFGVSRDITDRKRWEERILDSEERFRNLVQDSLIGISIIQNNRIVFQNPAQKKLYNASSEETLFQDLKNVHPEDLVKVKAAWRSIMTEEVQSAETDFRFYPSGRVGNQTDLKWVQCKATRFKYQGEDAILLNALDITKTKQLEHQLIIRNKMLSLGRVAAGIAHEIRNPLTGINSYLYTLEEMCRSEAIETEDIQLMRQIVFQIQIASDKINLVIKRVMDFSKPGVPKMVLTNINEPIEEAMELTEVAMRKKGITIEKSLAQDLPRCYADPHLIEQVVLNLATNAANVMNKTNGSKIIKIESFSENNTVFIKISDSGPGVPSELREKIFDPFFTTCEDGSGIGLNIAQRIVADHNGSIALDTSEWGGAEFRIELPIERRMHAR